MYVKIQSELIGNYKKFSKHKQNDRVVGDALMRSEANGKDNAFQFVINKAKLLSEVTITMQAEGDPSTNFYAA